MWEYRKAHAIFYHIYIYVWCWWGSFGPCWTHPTSVHQSSFWDQRFCHEGSLAWSWNLVLSPGSLGSMVKHWKHCATNCPWNNKTVNPNISLFFVVCWSMEWKAGSPWCKNMMGKVRLRLVTRHGSKLFSQGFHLSLNLKQVGHHKADVVDCLAAELGLVFYRCGMKKSILEIVICMYACFFKPLTSNADSFSQSIFGALLVVSSSASSSLLSSDSSWDWPGTRSKGPSAIPSSKSAACPSILVRSWKLSSRSCSRFPSVWVSTQYSFKSFSYLSLLHGSHFLCYRHGMHIVQRYANTHYKKACTQNISYIYIYRNIIHFSNMCIYIYM